MNRLPELDEVQENFNMGIICAQQVLTHFADRLGLPEETALRVASAFGSGMGRAEVCGCVSGVDSVFMSCCGLSCSAWR